MVVNKYFQVILDTLQGRTDELRDIPPERLDWAGPGALLELYRGTIGSDRTAFIRAIGRVIQKHPAPPAVIAQLIQIASGLDLAELDPQVRKLQAEPFASQEPLRDAITNYLAFRRLNAPPEVVDSARAANGKPKGRKARPEGEKSVSIRQSCCNPRGSRSNTRHYRCHLARRWRDNAW